MQKSRGDSITEIEKLFGCDLQNLAQLKHHIERNANVAQLNGADVTAVDLHQLRKAHLGQPLALAVIYHVQAELFVITLVFLFHIVTSHLYCTVIEGVHKPCDKNNMWLTQVKTGFIIDDTRRIRGKIEKEGETMKKILSLVLALVMALSLTTVAWGAEVTVANAAEAQAALDAAAPNTTIQLVENVDYGVLYLRPVDGSPATKTVDWIGNNYGFESYSCFENLTIIGAEGATVDAIVIEGGTYYHTAHSQNATYPVMLSLIELKNVVIDGVTFTGNGGQYGDSHGNAISLAGNNIKVDGLTLNNCVLKDTTNNNRLLYKTESTTTVHNYTYDGDPYTFVPSLKNITVTGCIFNGGYMGLELRETENLKITNNTFNGVASRDVLLAVNDGYTFSDKVTITGNTSDGAQNRFVRASGIGGAELIIAGNIIENHEGTDGDCIKVSGATGAVSIVGNALPADKTVTLNSIEGAIEITTNTNGKITSGTFNTDVSANVADSNTVVAKVNNVYIVGENDVKAAAAIGAKVTVLQGAVTLSNGTTLNSTSGEYTVPQPPVYYPVYVPTVEDTKVDSAQTFDAGIALYVGVSVMGAVGTVALSKKRED